MAELLLEDMFPALADEIAELRTDGFSDQQILGEISRQQGHIRETEGTEAAQFAFAPRAPQPSLGERLVQAGIRGLTFGGAGESFEPSESLGVNIAEMVAELAGTTPLLFAGGPVARLVGGAALRGLSPFVSRLIQQGAAPLVLGKTAQIGSRLATKGELPAAEEIFDPVEIALFGLFGAHQGLGVGRKISKSAGRVLELSETERGAGRFRPSGPETVRAQAIESTFRRPGEFRFKNPDVDRIARQVLGLPERAPGTVRDIRDIPPSELVLENYREALREGHEPTYRGLEPELLAGQEAITPETILTGVERFRAPLEPGTAPLPGQGTPPTVLERLDRLRGAAGHEATVRAEQMGFQEAVTRPVQEPAVGLPRELLAGAEPTPETPILTGRAGLEIPPGEAGTGARTVPTEAGRPGAEVSVDPRANILTDVFLSDVEAPGVNKLREIGDILATSDVKMPKTLRDTLLKGRKIVGARFRAPSVDDLYPGITEFEIEANAARNLVRVRVAEDGARKGTRRPAAVRDGGTSLRSEC